MKSANDLARRFAICVEPGEDYSYPREYFQFVELPQSVAALYHVAEGPAV